MKYFAYELFLAQNNENISELEQEKIQKKWNQNVLDYRALYKALANKISMDVYQHFSGLGFHDYQLLSWELEHKSLRKMGLRFTLSNDGGLSKIILVFHDVSSFEYHHENYHNEQPVMNRDIDQWLYEEFLTVDPFTLSFEVIFSSGASIALTFPNHAVSLKEER
ncbi:hypothetical protein FZC76_11050 [Sutcliffiella horikoshii]|uniref:Uncharacterized protein n=1 Tax=Sutcliffiella horikoshii TaxID=79883 RepID=A0A5D4SXX4_9BACI|nr:hypothetical protein [Sutcliffiella horikoshii]TYS68270.1 hypothetical protein FZC76_11050 [Sutcliffiella horikoshii]